jgi:hypothetical protein
MPEPDVAALIERIVVGARIPTRAARDDLRRELLTHFEDAGTTAGSVEFAIRRFGSEALVSESFRRVYRWDGVALDCARVAASIVASGAAALLILALVNLRVELEQEVWGLAPGFSRAVGMALAVVFGLVIAREAGRRPVSAARAALAIATYAGVCGAVELLFGTSVVAFLGAAVVVAFGSLCATLESRPLRWLLTLAAFAFVEYALHQFLRVDLAPARALLAGAMLVSVWASTLLIVARLDHAFLAFFESTAR